MNRINFKALLVSLFLAFSFESTSSAAPIAIVAGDKGM